MQSRQYKKNPRLYNSPKHSKLNHLIKQFFPSHINMSPKSPLLHQHHSSWYSHSVSSSSGIQNLITFEGDCRTPDFEKGCIIIMEFEFWVLKIMEFERAFKQAIISCRKTMYELSRYFPKYLYNSEFLSLNWTPY